MLKLLIIDDNPNFCQALSGIAADTGMETTCAHTAADGLLKAAKGGFDAVIIETRLPDGNGLDALPEIKSADSRPEVIVLTAFPDTKDAETAIMRHGAWDYLPKPRDLSSLKQFFSRLQKFRQEKNTPTARKNIKRGEIIGNSQVMGLCLELLARATVIDSSVLITGETGTGKEVFARAIHDNSARSEHNFVVVDCGAMPDTLVESLLFGHSKGSFTGADTDVEGFVLHADKGTLFLDEIGELSEKGQKALLRVLQDKKFHPVGSTKTLHSDFRLISATNRDLDKMASAGPFRNDLLFRLKSVLIDLPPLRERKEDIGELALYYLSLLWRSENLGMKEIAQEFYDTLGSYEWPGNVRELNSALEYATAKSFYESTLFSNHLPDTVRMAALKKRLEQGELSANSNNTIMKWKDHRKAMIEKGESEYLTRLMNESGGSVERAAQLSGMSRPWLYELIRKYGISIS